MADRFLLIAITPEAICDDEARKVTHLLHSGFDFVHLRHPAASVADMRAVVEQIPHSLRQRLKLHDHHSLALELGTGIQVNSRGGVDIMCPHRSIGCHSPEEVRGLDFARYEYVTLSPVFTSISKKDYSPVFDYRTAVAECATDFPLIALGGVTPDRLPALKAAGFAGAAMLGAILWSMGINDFIESI